MADISISLANIQTIKTVNIEGVGVLKARRLGSGEELDLSVKLRRFSNLVNELSAMDFMSLDAEKPDDYKKIQKMKKRASEISEEIEAVKRFELETYRRLLSDDQDGKVVDVIMDTLSDEERTELFKQIFGSKTEMEKPEPLTSKEAEDLINDMPAETKTDE